MLFRTPDLDLRDVQVLDEISAMREDLTEHVRVPRRWTGRLRRTALARAIQGSNSIEGYRVEEVMLLVRHFDRMQAMYLAELDHLRGGDAAQRSA